MIRIHHVARSRTPLICMLASLGVVGGAACDKPHTSVTSSASTVVASEQDNRVPGPVTVEVPRTGSQSSGTLGSSTVIGAPPKGQAGLAIAH